MSSTKKLFIWEFYLGFLIYLSVRDLIAFFDSSSPGYLYFFFLRAFCDLFYFNYFINLAQVILNVCACLPLSLWMYKKKLFNEHVWKVFFVAKVTADLFGMSFKKMEILSFYYDLPIVTSLMVLQYLCIYIPLYVVLYKYAFDRDNQLR